MSPLSDRIAAAIETPTPAIVLAELIEEAEAELRPH